MTRIVGRTRILPGDAVDPDPEPTGRAAYYGIADPWATVANMTTGQAESYAAAIAATGATWWRTDLRVFELEQTQGNRSWTQLDRVVAAIKGAGLNLLLCPSGLPAWAREGSPDTYLRGAITSGERAAYTAFVAAAASRYAADVGAWEIWNEPNYSQFWEPAPADATAYTALLKEAYAAVKPIVGADVFVLPGGPAYPGINPATWYASVYANGGGPYLDGTTVHPYPNIGWTRSGQPFTGDEMESVEAIRTTMNNAGDTAKPIWATENGFPTYPVSLFDFPVTEAEQASWMPQVWEGWYDQTTARGKTGPSFLYQYQDQDTSDTSSPEAHFGIVRSTGVLKPAHGTMLDWATEE